MRILIIGPSWVGDSVMAQTLYKRLKDEEPDCIIDVISPQWSLPLMKRMPEISKTIVSPYMHGDIKLLSRYKFGENLRINDELMKSDGNYEIINTIKLIEEEINVYNFEVDNDSTYFAEDYLVHHLCELCSGYSKIL